ncbi:MAG: hypothetical protein ABR576_07205 [Thermoanaerobaculia bacterium]
MRRVQTILFSVFLLAFSAALLPASPMSDFQARLAQTQWNIQIVEGLVKRQRASRREASAPESIESFLQLLAENVGALTAFSSSKVTDEQSRVIAEGIRTIAGELRDLTALISHRGFSSAAAEAQRLETTCRVAIADTD